MKKRNKKYLIGAGILGVLVIVGVLYSMGLLQDVFSTSLVYLPEYASVYCAPCNIGVQSDVKNVDVANTVTGKDFFFHYSVPTNDYIPNGYFIDITPSSRSGEYVGYKCNKGVSDSEVETALDEALDSFSMKDISNCIKYPISSFKDKTLVSVKLAKTEKFHLGVENDFTLKTFYQPFCLFTLERGQLSTYSSCLKSKLVSSVRDIPDDTPNTIPTGQEFAIENIVIGYSEVVNSVNVINGKFLRKSFDKFQSCNIDTDKEGIKYVNLLSCKDDSNIICLPSQPPTGFICNEGTNLVKIQEQGECMGTGVLGYRIDDSSVPIKQCELRCINGKQEIGTCKEVVGANKGEAVPETKQREPESNLNFWVIVGLIFLVLVLGLIVYALILRRKK